MLKTIIKKVLPNFLFFYQTLKYRLFILILASVLVGLLDGLGLAMFLPLIELFADPKAVVSTEGHGNFSYLLRIFDQMGISLNLVRVLLLMFIFFVFNLIIYFI